MNGREREMKKEFEINGIKYTILVRMIKESSVIGSHSDTCNQTEFQLFLQFVLQ